MIRNTGLKRTVKLTIRVDPIPPGSVPIGKRVSERGVVNLTFKDCWGHQIYKPVWRIFSLSPGLKTVSVTFNPPLPIEQCDYEWYHELGTCLPNMDAVNCAMINMANLS